jgi:hypothetical protein
MYRYLPCAVWLTAALSIAHAAEPAKPPPHPAATEAGARVPDTKYDSAFTGYRPYREQSLAPWRALNDEVHQAGGHIGIFGNAPGVRTTPAPPTSSHPLGHKK